PVVAGAGVVEAFPTRGGVEVEQDGEVGQEVFCRPEGDVAHGFGAEPAADALVGDGGVEVAVHDDDLPALERGPHLLGDVLGAARGEDERLGAGGDVVSAVQDDLAQLVTDAGAAGLPGAGDGVSGIHEPLLEQLRLRRLAAAVATLEGDEDAGHGYFFFAVRAAGLRVVVRFFAGPFARRSASSWMARSKSISSGFSPRGMVAFVSPSVT